MSAFLFAWNPIKWPWDDIEDDINHLEETGVLREHWSCASHRKIKPGDRAFIVTVAVEPKGIVGSGTVASEPFLAEHWSGKEKKRALYYRVKLEIDILLNPKIDPILTLDVLKLGALEHQQWAPQASGISIRPEAIDELEAVWFDFLATRPVRHNPFKNSPGHNIHPENITLSRYERNPFARQQCIDAHGLSCVVCGFNFEETYGDIGRDFIHIHQVQSSGEMAPVEDLRPVCANCHAMIHRRGEALSIEEMRRILKRSF
jgi:5-methylcytosine-specific restriction protein A